MTQEIAVRTSTAVAKYGDEDQIKFEMRALRQSLPGAATERDGKLLVSDELLRGLVIAAKYSELSPYRGEIYAVPGVGVMVASKIKANDAVTAAAQRGDTLDIRFETVLYGSPIWDENEDEYNLKQGDTVRICQITSSKVRAEFWKSRSARIDELHKIYGTGRDVGALIEAKLVEEFGNRPPVFTAIGVVKLGEYDGTENKNRDNKFVAYTRADKADKRALQRVLNKHGYAAADTRSYGGVTITEEPQVQPAGEVIDGAFKGAGSVRSDNQFPATSQVIEGDARPTTSATLRVDAADLQSEIPFGSTPYRKTEPKPVNDEGDDLIRAARAHWAKAATAASKAKRADIIVKIDGIADPAAIEDIAVQIERQLEVVPA